MAPSKLEAWREYKQKLKDDSKRHMQNTMREVAVDTSDPSALQELAKILERMPTLINQLKSIKEDVNSADKLFNQLTLIIKDNWRVSKQDDQTAEGN